MRSRTATIALTRKAAHAKPDDPRPAFAYDDTVQHHLLDAELSLPLDKLNGMQAMFIKAGNLKAPYDLRKIAAPEIRGAALKRLGG